LRNAIIKQDSEERPQTVDLTGNVV
jgi:hypothetical protein